jgi:hypothetical protein
MTRRELYLGVAVGMEHPGATLTIMEKDGDRTKVYYTGTHPKGETISRLPFELLAAVPPVVNAAGDPFLPGQWWLERMEALWGRGEVDDDTRRAAKIACDFAAAVFAGQVTPAARDVLAERRRQIEVEGFTAERDDKYINCELARAAATYATCSHIEQLKLVGEQAWPWHPEWFKRSNYRDDLIKAGALILAEIERLDRDGGAS